MGSDPVLRMKIRGVEGDISLYRFARSTGGFSTNCFPRLTITNSVAANTTYTGEGGSESQNNRTKRTSRCKTVVRRDRHSVCMKEHDT